MPTLPRSRLAHGARAGLALLATLTLLAFSGVRSNIPKLELLPKYATSASKFATVDGVSVHYRDEGVGDPLILIHGTSSSLHTWDAWVERLRTKRRIVRLDLPGFGLTGPAPDHDYRATRYARLVSAMMDQLGIDAADVAGNSLGGRVAMTLALEHPERVRKLILIDASGLSGQKPPAIFALARTPLLGNLLRWVTPRVLVAKNVGEVYGDASRITEALVDRYYDLTRREGNRDALVDRLTAHSDPDLDLRLREIHADTLVLWGEQDRWIPLPFAHRLKEGLPFARLVTYPTAGHVPMEELPEATADEAEGFLEAAPNAQAAARRDISRSEPSSSR